MKGLTARTVALMGAIGMLLALQAVAAQAAFPGEDGRIAYTHVFEDLSDEESVTNPEIFSVDPSGLGEVNLTNTVPVSSEDPLGREVDPAWSADGTMIAFSNRMRFTDPFTFRTRITVGIYVMNADGSGRRLVTVSSRGDKQPAWSPDGTRIAFTRHPVDPDSDVQDAEGEIFTINVDGTGLTRVTDNPEHDADPAWSPDGTRIAFTSNRAAPNPDGDFDIYTVRPDGTGLQHLIDVAHSDLEPNWSPDGEKIAFTSNVDGDFGNGIYVMNSDDSDLIRLTSNDAEDLSPAWSPTGTRIAFARQYYFTSSVLIMRPDGSDERKLTQSSFPEGNPDWQPLPFKNAARKCKAFPGGYRNHGQCVKANR